MLLVTSSKYVYRLKIRLVEGIVSFAIFDLVFCFISDKKCFYAKSVTMRKKKKRKRTSVVVVSDGNTNIINRVDDFFSRFQ